MYRKPNSIPSPKNINSTQTRISIGDLGPYINNNFENRELTFCLYVEENGVKDFYQSEYIVATGLDAGTNELIIERGAFETTPRAFESGKTGIAEIAVYNHETRSNRGRFHYNFSTLLPKDRSGRTASEAPIDELEYRANNDLSFIDGIEFDASSVATVRQYFNGYF